MQYTFDDFHGDNMTMVDGDLFVPTIIRSILIITFKEEIFEFTTKTDSMRALQTMI